MESVLITGANRGIGLELVRRYLHEGWQVHACCRDPERARELQAEGRDGSPLTVHRLDVLDDDAIAALQQTLRDQPLDLLINNAGSAGDKDRQSFGNMDYAAWAEMFRINTMAPMKITEALVDNLLAGRYKHVITISSGLASIAGQQGYLMAYSSTKAAMNAVMKSLSVTLQDEGIRVNMISPGWVKTAMGGPDADLTPQQAATRIFQNIDALEPEDTGLFISHEGNIIPW